MKKLSKEKVISLIKCVYNNYSKDKIDSVTFISHLDYLSIRMEGSREIYLRCMISTKSYYVINITIPRKGRKYEEIFITLPTYKYAPWGLRYDYRGW